MNIMKEVASALGFKIGEPFLLVDRDGLVADERHRFSMNNGLEFEASDKHWEPEDYTAQQSAHTKLTSAIGI